MPHFTRWFGRPVPSDRARSFLWAGFKHYLRALCSARGRRNFRTPDVVRKHYDELRNQMLAELAGKDWETFISTRPDDEDFILADDRIVWGPLRPVMGRLSGCLREAVRAYCRPGGVVVEFGSGDGSNLLLLKSLFPDVHFIGLELSPASVEYSRQAARKFGLDVTYHECDATGPLAMLPAPGAVHLAFSSFALEQMPRVFVGAVRNMLACSSRGVVFLEPAGELYPWNLRGLVARMRVRSMDRLRGLPPALKQLTAGTDWTVTKARRLGFAVNPLCEGCEIHVARAGFLRERGRAANGTAGARP
jgi:hypothetical protein